MYDISSVAFVILLGCLLITWLLGKARLFGSLTLAGFVLGALATASLIVLLG
jgi:hypothetical protein